MTSPPATARIRMIKARASSTFRLPFVEVRFAWVVPTSCPVGQARKHDRRCDVYLCVPSSRSRTASSIGPWVARASGSLLDEPVDVARAQIDPPALAVHVTPGRGNGKAAQAVERVTVADRTDRLVQVDEAPAVAAANPAGLSTVGGAGVARTAYARVTARRSSESGIGRSSSSGGYGSGIRAGPGGEPSSGGGQISGWGCGGPGVGSGVRGSDIGSSSLLGRIVPLKRTWRNLCCSAESCGTEGRQGVAQGLK